MHLYKIDHALHDMNAWGRCGKITYLVWGSGGGSSSDGDDDLAPTTVKSARGIPLFCHHNQQQLFHLTVKLVSVIEMGLNNCAFL